MYIPVLLAIGVFILCYFSRRNNKRYSGHNDNYKKRIGEKGERKIKSILEKAPGNKRILMNCYLQTSEGTTEIDVLMIHETGIYVFESKNYSGWIYGTADRAQWTQTFNHYNWRTRQSEVKKFHFQNPIIQNKYHIKWLKKYLSEKVEKIPPFHSVIVFGDQCSLKTPIEICDEYEVLEVTQVASELTKKYSELPQIFLPEEIDNLYDLLSPLCNVTDKTKRQHIEQVNARHGNICSAS